MTVPTETLSWIQIGFAAALGAICLYVEPSLLHACGWALAILTTYLWREAEEHIKEMLYDLTHFDPTPP